MALDRKAAKRAIDAQSDFDPELLLVQKQAAEAKLALLKEENSHSLKVEEQRMGALGKFWGEGATAPTFISLIALTLSLVLVAGIYVAAYNSGHFDQWFSQVDILLAFAGTAFGFLAGQAVKKV
jgi:hypothetical protein